MGTRGAMGVRIGGVDKIAYNHFDSYPSGLGDKLVADIRLLLRDPGLDGMRELATDLRVVNDKTEKPTPVDVKKLKRFTDLGVGGQSEDDWYCLTETHPKGRYASMPLHDEERRANSGSVYYPVALAGSFDLADIPQNWAEQAFPEEPEEET